MAGKDDRGIFVGATVGIRKPVVRFNLHDGRRVELIGFHLEPGWALGQGSPRSIAKEVVQRLYPHARPIFVNSPEDVEGPAWLCVAYLYSDLPVERPNEIGNYSLLLVCGMVSQISGGIQAIVSSLLASVDWDESAVNDFLW